MAKKKIITKNAETFLRTYLNNPSPTGFETEGQKETYTKYRRGIVKGRMLDAFINDNEAEALKIMKAWNNAYPEEYFTSDDMDASAIYDRIIKKEEKRLKP